MERLDRAERRRLLKEDEAWLGRALPPRPPRRVAEAHVRHLALMLRDTNLEHRAVRAATYAGEIFDATLAREKKGPVACAKGCFHCCTKLVMATIPDIFRLAQPIVGKTAKISEIQAAAETSRAITHGQKANQRLPCPVLDQGACSAYAARPIPCRFLLSQSLAACVRIFEEASGEAFPFTEGTLAVRHQLDAIVRAALMLAGLPANHYDLIGALAVALTADNAEDRWLAGAPLFAHVAVNANDFKDAAYLASIEKMAADLAPTL